MTLEFEVIDAPPAAAAAAAALLPRARRPALLLASISERSSQRGAPHLQLQLPLPLLGALVAGAGRLREPLLRAPGGGGGGKRVGLPPPPAGLVHAGAEARRAATLLGGLLVAGASQAAARLAGAAPARLGRRRGRGAGGDGGFAFPWDARGAAASASRREAAALAAELCARGRRYERARDVRAAAQCYEEAVRLAPADALALCMAAKQWSDLTFHDDVRSRRERQLVNLKAIELSDRAIAADPGAPHGHLSSCVARGRLALFSETRDKVRLAAEARDAAAAALAAAPDSDAAHHLWGRWHYEMSRLNRVTRAMVRLVYGARLAPGCRRAALASYRRAVELAPGRLVHRVEAARVLAELGRRSEARAQLAAALACDVEDINAWHTRQDAVDLLAALDGRPSRPGWAPLPPAPAPGAGGDDAFAFWAAAPPPPPLPPGDAA